MARLHPPGVEPIIPGFAPDPSVVFVGDTFFLAASSFHFFPGIPIFASKDLVSWQQVGNAINRTSQLSLSRSSTRLKEPDTPGGQLLLATGGLYAPTIRHKDGVTYIVCTNFIHIGPEDFRLENFIISTRDVWSDIWSDPVYFEYHGIDPSLFWDDDGRVYIQGSAWGSKTRISCIEIDLDSGRTLSPEKDIWDGFSQVIPEGPHVYKKDGFYYLIIAEGGTSEDHSIAAARSTSVWGPYEPCTDNPILRPATRDAYVQHTGHGDFFQDGRGQWWMACLGVRKTNGRYHLGRESFLTRAEWTAGGWPVIEPFTMRSNASGLDSRVPPEPAVLNLACPTVDLVYIRDPDLSSFSVSANGRDIRIWPQPASLSDNDGPISFIGRRQRAVNGQASVRMRLGGSSEDKNSEAGLVLYKDEHRFAGLFYCHATFTVTFQVINGAKSISNSSQFTVRPNSSTMDMSIRYTAQELDFRFQTDGDDEVHAGLIDTLSLTGYDFVGPVIGLFSRCATKSTTADIFLDFQIDQPLH